MADEFLERLGEITVASAWLEGLVLDFIHILVGTKKVAVFTRRMSFGAQCSKLEELLAFSTDKTYVKDVKEWIRECKEIARERNDLIHTRHRSEIDGTWRRVEPDAEVSLKKMAAIPARIATLYDHGLAYQRGMTDEHRQTVEDDARLDAILEGLSD